MTTKSPGNETPEGSRHLTEWPERKRNKDKAIPQQEESEEARST